MTFLEKLQQFFTQLFTELSNEDSIIVLLFLLVSFLIGVLFTWWARARRIRKLRKALKEKESALITLQAEHDALKEKMEQKLGELETVKAENEEFQALVSRLEREKAAIQGDLYAAKDQIEKLQSENLSNLSRIDALSTEISELQTANTQLGVVNIEKDGVSSEELTQIQNDYALTNDRLAALEAKLNRLESENSGLRAEISSIKDASILALPEEEEEVEIEEEVFTPDAEEEEDPAIIARRAVKAAIGNRINVASAEERDDLKKINGIGPFIEEKLNEISIYTYEQISQLDDNLIEQITNAIQFFPGRIKRDDWVGQAQQLKG